MKQICCVGTHLKLVGTTAFSARRCAQARSRRLICCPWPVMCSSTEQDSTMCGMGFSTVLDPAKPRCRAKPIFQRALHLQFVLGSFNRLGIYIGVARAACENLVLASIGPQRGGAYFGQDPHKNDQLRNIADLDFIIPVTSFTHAFLIYLLHESNRPSARLLST